MTNDDKKNIFKAGEVTILSEFSHSDYHIHSVVKILNGFKLDELFSSWNKALAKLPEVKAEESKAQIVYSMFQKEPNTKNFDAFVKWLVLEGYVQILDHREINNDHEGKVDMDVIK